MPAFIETGHAKNVANFLDLITFCQGYGATYNPSKASIKIPALQTLQTNALNSVNAVTNKNTAYNNAVNARVIAFKDIKHLGTRLLNAIQTTDATDEMIGNAKSINRKIQGKRAKAVTTPTTPPDPNAPAPTTISASQQSYDQQIEHFNAMVELLKTEPTYTPNEADLKILALGTYYTKLTTTNTAVATAYTSVSNARITRDKALYLPTTGLYDVAQEVKKYIKSIFGATSPEYKQVSGIKFAKRKV
jgi:hypothetical protein